MFIVYQDLLIITSTSQKLTIEIDLPTSNQLKGFQEFYNFFTNNLKFINVFNYTPPILKCSPSESSSSDEMDFDFDDIDMDLNLNRKSPAEQVMMSQNQFDIFYQNNSIGDETSCWYGTLLKIKRMTDRNFKMKIYHQREDKIVALIRAIKMAFLGEIRLFNDNQICFNEILLQNAFRNEMEFFINTCDNNVDTLEKRQDFRRNRSSYEMKTDLLVLNQ